MITYCIIDDEPIAHRIIEGYCAELSYLQKVGNAYNALEASKIVAQERLDLIFLDLNMPKMTGFEWLKTLSKPPKIIVTTAHKEYALEGYELNVSDYLLKPFSFQRFLKAMNKVMDQPSVINPSPGNKKTSFFLKGDKKMHQIHTDDILFIEAYGNYIKVFLEGGMVVAHEKISALETLLSPSGFLRTHKSFIVAASKITSIEGNRISVREHYIPIGQTYRQHLKQLFKGK